MYEKKFLKTSRLTTAYYRAGENNSTKLLLVHGNVCSSDVYLPLFPQLSEDYDVVAIDLRCFGDTTPLPVDPKRGFRDWSDDIDEFVNALKWDKFVFCGWSMGGEIAMQYLIDHSEKVEKAIFICPGSPFGYGGTKGVDGEILEPAGIGSGAACVNAQLIEILANQDFDLMKASVGPTLFAGPLGISEEDHDRIIRGMLKTKLGDDMYPGTVKHVDVWPFVAAGDRGLVNTMASIYADVSAFANIPNQAPILWIRGDSDIMVSDNCPGEFGFLGKMGFVEGWPGEDVYPPQPMVSQTRNVLDRYAANGGSYKEVVLQGGHAICLEKPDEFVAEIKSFIG